MTHTPNTCPYCGGLTPDGLCAGCAVKESQHDLTAQQAADLVRGSYAVLWAAAHHGTEIRGGYARPDSETAADSGGQSPDDI